MWILWGAVLRRQIRFHAGATAWLDLLQNGLRCDVRLVVVEIEEVPVQILYRELPQSPRFGLQGIHDVRT